jgi:hypothetical protein
MDENISMPEVKLMLLDEVIATLPFEEALERLRAVLDLGGKGNKEIIKLVFEMPLDELRHRLAVIQEAQALCEELTH